MAGKRFAPIHPGEILEEEFMRPLGLSANGLAKAVDVPVTRISEIVRGRRGVTADTALRLGRYFGTSPELWLGLQSEYDLRLARRDMGRSIESRVVPLTRAARQYESHSARNAVAHSEVRESTDAYGSGRQTRTRDRRRARRSP